MGNMEDILTTNGLQKCISAKQNSFPSFYKVVDK